MINPFAEVQWTPDTPARHAFGRSLIIGFPIVATLLFLIRWWVAGLQMWPVYLGATGVAIGALCWAVPSVARPFYVLWYGIGCSIGLVVSNTAITAIYFLVLAPIGLLMRAMGRNPVRRTAVDGSFWVVRGAKAQRADIERQF